MASAIKIPRDVFLKKLKTRLLDNDKAIKSNEKLRIEHEKATAKWEADLVKYICKNPSVIKSAFVQYNKCAQLSTSALDFPDSPRFEGVKELASYERDELLQTIAVIELSNAEFVPASITKNASRFLI